MTRSQEINADAVAQVTDFAYSYEIGVKDLRKLSLP
jgi:hypothetical protein